MAITLTIGGVDFMPQYISGSIRIDGRIENKSATCAFQVRQTGVLPAPSAGQEVIVKDGSRFLFGGHIVKSDPEEIGKGAAFLYSIEAMDYSYILVNKYAQKSYSNTTLGAVVLDLLSQYVSSTYNMTHANVQTGPAITTISFNHISLRKCFEKLAKTTGYVWWVDFTKDLHFESATSAPAPENFTDSSANFTDLAIVTDTSQVRNSVIVMGGLDGTGKRIIAKQASSTSIASLKTIEGGDGIHEYFIRDATIKSQIEAIQRGQKELADFANPIISGSIKTRTSLLAGGSYFSAGQYITINFPTWGINSNTSYLIQEVVTTVNENQSGAAEYMYEIRFGGRVLGIAELMNALADPETTDTDTVVSRIIEFPESATVTENLHTPTKTNPPYVYGSGKWGLSTWG